MATEVVSEHVSGAPQTFFAGPSAAPNLEEIKVLLEDKSSNKNKLMAMQRLIAMISKGKDVSSVFPQVVKNIICNNVEVKKLVYMYLTHYAEVKQDVALLSVNSFQMELKNPNQIVRAQALRSLTSIRLPLIAQILILSVKAAVDDISPYVRKTAAHSIIKVFELEPSHASVLIKFINSLLNDPHKMVVNSVIPTFYHVCPHRYDLLHPQYRKLVNYLPDLSEFTQTYLLTILTRYARTFFLDPNATKESSKPKPVKSFFDDVSSDEDDERLDLDSDFELLLNKVKGMFHSRSESVIIAASLFYFYCAPSHTLHCITKPLIRILRETYPAYIPIILSTILTIARSRPELFRSYLGIFYVLTEDNSEIKRLKLEILVNLATEDNIKSIFHEFEFYLKQQYDLEFVRDTIHAIGRCGLTLPSIRDLTMKILLKSIERRSEIVLAELVVTIKSLIQADEGNSQNGKLILQFIGLLDKIHAKHARACIIWAIGEYCSVIHEYVPDKIRILAKLFIKEESEVKLQILNASCKAFLQLPNYANVLSSLFQYICNLAKYDTSYDIRDRARAFYALIISPNVPTLRNHVKALLCATKPVPFYSAHFIEKDRFSCGSLSHFIGKLIPGYDQVPPWNTEPINKTLRDHTVFGDPVIMKTSKSAPKHFFDSSREEAENFYREESDESYTDSDSYSSDSDSFTSSSEEDRSHNQHLIQQPKDLIDNDFGFTTQNFYSKVAHPFFDSAPPPAAPQKSKAAKSAAPPAPVPAASSIDSFFGSAAQPSSSDSKPSSSNNNSNPKNIQASSSDSFGDYADLISAPVTFPALPSFTAATIERKKEILLKKIVGQGLEVEYLFLRRESLHGKEYSPIQLWFNNHSDQALENVRIKFSETDKIIPFDEINFLPPNSNATATLNISFQSPSAPLTFQIVHDQGSYKVQLAPHIGELIHPDDHHELASKFKGLNSYFASLPAIDNPKDYFNGVLRFANVHVLSFDDNTHKYKFTGTTILDNEALVITLERGEEDFDLKLKCGSPMFATSFQKQLAKYLSSSTNKSR